MARTTAEHVFNRLQQIIADVKLLATCDHLLRRTEPGGRAADAIEAARRNLSVADVALGNEIFGPPTPEPVLKILPVARRAQKMVEILERT